MVRSARLSGSWPSHSPANKKKKQEREKALSILSEDVRPRSRMSLIQEMNAGWKNEEGIKYEKRR
jgi:hypothetical protein